MLLMHVLDNILTPTVEDKRCGTIFGSILSLKIGPPNGSAEDKVSNRGNTVIRRDGPGQSSFQGGGAL